MKIPNVEGKPPRELLLYGSVTRDDEGCFYLGGTRKGERGGDEPVLFQAKPAK